MCVADIVKFDFPIGWNELGVIATVLAVIVALYSNRKATKQLKSALEMQEQSKNVGLLDKRIELAEKIRCNKSVPEWTLRVLFDNNSDIVGHYTAWQNYLSEVKQAQDEISRLSVKYNLYEKDVIQDHPEIEKRRSEATSSADAEKQITLQLIEKFVADSIKSLRGMPK